MGWVGGGDGGDIYKVYVVFCTQVYKDVDDRTKLCGM